MSTSSSATASGRYHVPSDDPHLKTKICVFIVTKKDSTLLDVTSVSEKDIIEICVTLGHTHPLGALWYLVTELVALSCTTEEMQWASCAATKATELQDEPIAMQTNAPLEHHTRAYIAIVGGDPPKPWSLPSEGQSDSHSPTGNPHPGGGTLHCLWAELGNLTDQELHQLIEDLHQEIALCKLHAPPAILSQHLGENHQGVVILMGMTRRSPSQEGRVGFPKTTTSISCPSTNRWRVGSSGTTSSTPKACSSKSRHGAPNQHIGIRIMLRYPKNKHLQWWGYAR